MVTGPDTPGPEYDVLPTARAARPTAAPFGSSQQRSVKYETDSPAPGQYNVLASPIKGTSFGVKPTPFMTTTERFRPATGQTTPGEMAVISVFSRL